MTLNSTKLFICLALVSLCFFSLTAVLAANQQQVLSPEAQSALQKQDTAFIEASGLGTQVTFAEMISYIIKVVLSFLGVIFVILIIYAGFMWMTSAGNEEAIKKAKQVMVAAVIGLTIILAAYIITYYVIDVLLEATQGGTGLD